MRLTVFSLIPAIGGLLQVLLKNAPYAVMGNVLGVFNMYCGRQNSRINTDALTGINNRGRAEEYLEGIQKNVKDNPIYIYMLDVDNFKFVNDTFGHNEGDRCLRALADALQAVGRITPSLFISRIGGDEFLCTSDVARTDPEVVMEAIRKTFSEQTKLKNMSTEVSLSIGYSIYDNPSVRIVDVMHAADQALYREKQQHHSLRA
ncbi:MAG: GGDEF domain-containing protein [Oribacterium sp.]|nr:GGDEF domain-containing protein [Oribacterium sp.]